MKKFLATFLISTLSLSLVSCTGGASKTPTASEATSTSQNATTNANEKLTVWVSGALVSENDQKKTQDQWVISKIAKAFEAENPGVTVEIVLSSDQIASMQMFKAAQSTKDAPDIVNVWAGQQLFELKDIVLELTDKIPEEDKNQIIGWDTTTLDFKVGNPILGYPTSGNEVCGIFYNKKILAECGLDYDTNPAKTLDQFTKDLQIIKDKGFLPMAAGDGGWNESFFVTYASWWVQASGSDRVVSNSLGQTKFSDDKGFKDALQAGLDLYTNGFVNKDYSTIPNSCKLFQEGNAAFLTTGNWNAAVVVEALGEENVGFINPPDINDNVLVKSTCIGGTGQTLAISKTSKNPELAIKFVSFVSQRDNMITILKDQSKLPLRKDISPEDLGIASTGIYRQMFDAAQNYVFWADNSMTPGVNEEVQKSTQLVLTGKMTIDEFTKKLDDKAAELAK